MALNKSENEKKTKCRLVKIPGEACVLYEMCI